MPEEQRYHIIIPLKVEGDAGLGWMMNAFENATIALNCAAESTCYGEEHITVGRPRWAFGDMDGKPLETPADAPWMARSLDEF